MRLYLILLWLLALAAPPAQDGLSLSASAGYDGYYRPGTTTPIYVEVRNDGPAVEGEVSLAVRGGAAGEPLRYTAPISLPTGSNKRVPLYVNLPSFVSDLTVDLRQGETVLATANTNRLDATPTDDLLYGVISPSPGGLAFLQTMPGDRAAADVAFLDPADLPDLSIAWQGLDLLVFHDTDTSRLTAAQSNALRTWVENGGQLVVTGGVGGPQTAAGVANLLPVTIDGVVTVPELPALESFTGSAPATPGPYTITGSTLREGEVLLDEDGLPLLAHRPLGLGGVWFLALDPTLASDAGWAGQPALWQEIARGVPVRPPWGGGVRDGYAATQAASAIPGLSLPSPGALLLFILLYTVVIGPLNYVILRRLNRRELAWLTIPALVLLFSGITYFTAFRTRGGEAMVNRVSVAYGSIEAERVRTQTVIGLYSPRRGVFDMVTPYDTAAIPFVQGFGEMATVGNLDAIVRAGDLTLTGLRTDTGEVATVLADAHLPRPALSGEAVADEHGDIRVTVRNDGAATLAHAVIIHETDIFPLGDLAAGETSEMVLTVSAAPTVESSLATPTPLPLFPAGATTLHPLLNDPSPILGTADYFNDPAVFPRWQFLQSLYDFSDTTMPGPSPAVVLGGWLPESAQAVVVENEGSAAGTTDSAQALVLLEIPVR